MISDIRIYFNDILKSLGYREHKDGFNSDNIGATVLDKAYHLSYSISSSEEPDDIKMIDTYSIDLKVFFKGYRDVQASLDSAYDNCHTIRLELVNRENIDLFNVVKDNPLLTVFARSITAEAIESNDNSILITVSLEARRIFTNC